MLDSSGITIIANRDEDYYSKGTVLIDDGLSR
jgi:hypothetical protein